MEPKAKKQGRCLTIAVVAFVLSLIAVALAGVCSWYWWHYPWAVGAPALAFAIIAIVLGCAKPEKCRVTAMFSAVVSLLCAIACIIWCAVEIAFCHSPQNYGEFRNPLQKDSTWLDFKAGYYSNLNLSKLYYVNGDACKGRCFDWAYRKRYYDTCSCTHKVFNYYYGKFGKDFEQCTDNGENKCSCTGNIGDKINEGQRSRRSPGPSSGGESCCCGPIAQTHCDIKKRSEIDYSKKYLKLLDTNRTESCKEFDDSKYTKQRKKCDDAYTKMFGEPECEPKKGGFTRKKSGKISDLPIECLLLRQINCHRGSKSAKCKELHYHVDILYYYKYIGAVPEKLAVCNESSCGLMGVHEMNRKPLVVGGSCKAPDPCKDVRCLNKGQCENAICKCVNGFHGKRCEKSVCHDNTCRHGGTCTVDYLGEPQCQCARGYSGKTCQF